MTIYTIITKPRADSLMAAVDGTASTTTPHYTGYYRSLNGLHEINYSVASFYNGY